MEQHTHQHYYHEHDGQAELLLLAGGERGLAAVGAPAGKKERTNSISHIMCLQRGKGENDEKFRRGIHAFFFILCAIQRLVITKIVLRWVASFEFWYVIYFDKILGKCGFAASVSSKPLLILSETVSDTISDYLHP